MNTKIIPILSAALLLFAGCTLFSGDAREIKSSFNGFLDNLSAGSIAEAEEFFPMLTDMDPASKEQIISEFLKLKEDGYSLSIKRLSSRFVLNIDSKQGSVLDSVPISVKKLDDGSWQMQDAVTSIQFYDVIPAEK